jgi:Bacterial Ig-like domain (group 1)
MRSDCLPKLSAILLVATLVLAGLALAGLPTASAQVNVLTNKMDNSRTGQNPNETLLSSSNVNPTQFGKLFSFNVDGYVQAQPLYISALTIGGVSHNVVFVATQHDSVYAIDGDTGVQYWQTNFLNPAGGVTTVPAQAEGCNNVTGFNELGIVGTPVIDHSTGTLYVTAKTQEVVAGHYTYVYRLHALDVTTGLEKFGGPVQITGQIGTLNFVPLNQIQRPGLLLTNGTLYLGFGSNGCDLKARGWLFAYSASTLQQIAQMTTQPDNSYGSSIWQGGVGPAADSAGNIFLSTANGFFNYSGLDFGDSILKLSLSGNTFTVDDYFTPFDQATMAATDTDLGSGGVTLLPPQPGSSTPNLLVASGKDADIYLVNRDNLGQYNATNNDQITQYIPAALGGELFGTPVYWNNTLYFLAHQDYLKAYALSITKGVSAISTTPIAQTASKLTNVGFPVLSANGNTNGIVWVVRAVKGVQLMSAYDASRLFLMYDSSMAAGGRDSLGAIGHSATPIVANGKVYVGTQTQLVAYGLFPSINPASGNNQSGSAGTTLPIPITVVASNPYTGTPIPGVTVTFSDGGKKGTFGSPTAVTDSNGLASSTYTLPNLPQTVTITVTSAGYASASFTEQGNVGPVASLSIVSGSKQIGMVGTTLPLPVIIGAKDAVGNAVPNASVSFTDGVGGIFTPNPAVTASNGSASTSYTLPTVAKSLSVTASVGSINIKLSEQSIPGSATALNLIQGNNQTAHVNTKLAKSLIVSVTDKYGNGISGLTVTFTDNGAGGTFSTTTPVTNNSGQATVTYTTPGHTGTVTINASYSTLASVIFTETVN